MLNYSINKQDIEWYKLIKGLRFTQSLTQEQLGKRLNLKRTQLLKYEQGIIPRIKNRKKILDYIQNNKQSTKKLLEIYAEIEYLDKHHLWSNLIIGIQTVNGMDNKKIAESLDMGKSLIESWKTKKSIPKLNTKLKILKLIKNKNIEALLAYSYINWKNLFYELKDRLGISQTMFSKLLGAKFNTKFISQFRVKKKMLEIEESIRKGEDIRDIIFKLRKDKFTKNRYLFLRYIRIRLGLSQKGLTNLIPTISQTAYSRFELGYNRFSKNKRTLIEKVLGEISKKQGMDFNKHKKYYFSQVKKLEAPELDQWDKRKNIHKIIGFRSSHNKEECYLNQVIKILKNQNFMTFKNVILADKNLNTFDTDIYAFKIVNHKKIEICFEVRDRKNIASTSITFLHNINRLNKIKELFNLDYSILIVPNLSQERKRYFHGDIVLLDNKDLLNFKNEDILKFLQKKHTYYKIAEVNTPKDLKRYLKQNRLTLRDVSSFIDRPSFSHINNWTNSSLKNNKEKLIQLISIINDQGVAYIKFQRHKKIYTNKNFLKLKAIKNYLSMNENDFKTKFGTKPSELMDKCLRGKDNISRSLLLKIKDYTEKNNYNWVDLINYVKFYTNKELKRWEKLEKFNKKVGWKFIKFSDNTNEKSKQLENKTSNFLSKRYKYVLGNVYIYLKHTNQIREVDLISFNTDKDMLVTECKSKIPAYGSKILLNDLDIIKKGINAKNSLLVTQETDLNKEFDQIKAPDKDNKNVIN